ncbi:MAG: hypothetical protein AB1488_06555 [Nitrospirota bacterium]
MGLLAKGLLLCYAWLFYWCAFTIDITHADIFTNPLVKSQKSEVKSKKSQISNRSAERSRRSLKSDSQVSPQQEVDNLIKDAQREFLKREIQEKKILYVFVGDCPYSIGAIKTANEFSKSHPDYDVKIFSTVFDGKRFMELKKQWGDDMVIHIPGEEIEMFKIEKIPAFVFVRDGKFHKVYGQPKLGRYLP